MNTPTEPDAQESGSRNGLGGPMDARRYWLTPAGYAALAQAEGQS